MVCINWPYQLPLGSIVVGMTCMVSAVITMLATYFTDSGLTPGLPGSDFRDRPLTHYMLGLCAFGGFCMLVGCCTCCTVYSRIQRNWKECKRLQKIQTSTRQGVRWGWHSFHWGVSAGLSPSLALPSGLDLSGEIRGGSALYFWLNQRGSIKTLSVTVA